ncbi:type II toxin-antitoxin system VapB family antitoxin [Nostoc sp.]|uniref:type II toxin-antitoxin system VapB family antitoxin n=1 Tax=Nostoc sp. TaxID=1180 RepID=UPI002FF6D87B
MAIDAEILQTLDQMPESLKQELLHYAKYLVENYSKTISQETLLQQKRRSGILKGTFLLPLPDDFDEPLEVFKEYME